MISTLGMGWRKTDCFLQTPPSRNEQNQKPKKPKNMPRTVKIIMLIIVIIMTMVIMEILIMRSNRRLLTMINTLIIYAQNDDNVPKVMPRFLFHFK